MTRTRSINFPNTTPEFEALFDKLQRPLTNQVLNSGAIAIKTSSSPIVKSVSTMRVLIDGVLVSKTASDMAALVGTLPTTGKAVWVFTVNAAGTLKTYASNLDSTTLAGIMFPEITDGDVVLGFILVENGTGSNFVGGTTALDTGSLTVTYVNTPFPFLPELKEL